jgi:hypothetical protein
MLIFLFIYHYFFYFILLPQKQKRKKVVAKKRRLAQRRADLARKTAVQRGASNESMTEAGDGGGGSPAGLFHRLVQTLTPGGSGFANGAETAQIRAQVRTLESEVAPLEEFGRHLFLELVELFNMRVCNGYIFIVQPLFSFFFFF